MTVVTQLHLLVVVLFLLLIGTKVVLLLLNKHNMLNKVRTRTRVLDMVFGGLMLISGFYLAFSSGYFSEGWLLVKLAAVLVATPLAIVGLRKHSKPLSVLSLLLLFYAYGVAETKSPLLRSAPVLIADEVPAAATATANTEAPTTAAPTAKEATADTAAAPAEILGQLDASTKQNAASMYAQLCARCHGLNGEPVLAAAPDLRKLTCPKRAITGTIYSGRGQMPSFKDVLTREEISRLADYVEGMQEPG